MVSFMGLIPMNSSHGSDSHVLILVFSVHLIPMVSFFILNMFPYGVWFPDSHFIGVKIQVPRVHSICLILNLPGSLLSSSSKLRPLQITLLRPRGLVLVRNCLVCRLTSAGLWQSWQRDTRTRREHTSIRLPCLFPPCTLNTARDKWTVVLAAATPDDSLTSNHLSLSLSLPPLRSQHFPLSYIFLIIFCVVYIYLTLLYHSLVYKSTNKTKKCV